MPSPSTDEIAAQDYKALSTPQPVEFNEIPLGTPRRGMRLSSGRRVVVRSDGKPKYLLVVIEDVTERKAAEARIKYLAEHDALTGLPNRAAFQQKLHSMLESARSAETSSQFCAWALIASSRSMTCLAKRSVMQLCARLAGG
jgi:predicted signal transduction protein with EAL and GGDEF domain